MTAMVQDFDGVRELSMEEVDAVAGGPGGAARAVIAARVLDHFGNQDGDPFDEGGVVAGGIAAGFGVGASFGCAPCAPIGAGFGAISAGFFFADTFFTE